MIVNIILPILAMIIVGPIIYVLIKDGYLMYLDKKAEKLQEKEEKDFVDFFISYREYCKNKTSKETLIKICNKKIVGFKITTNQGCLFYSGVLHLLENNLDEAKRDLLATFYHKTQDLFNTRNSCFLTVFLSDAYQFSGDTKEALAWVVKGMRYQSEDFKQNTFGYLMMAAGEEDGVWNKKMSIMLMPFSERATKLSLALLQDPTLSKEELAFLHYILFRDGDIYYKENPTDPKNIEYLNKSKELLKEYNQTSDTQVSQNDLCDRGEHVFGFKDPEDPKEEPEAPTEE